MEAKINIAEILRNKPIGTKLYSSIFGDVKLRAIKHHDDYPIIVETFRSDVDQCRSFSKNGLYYNGHTNTEPTLFPSRNMRDWSKFAWKKGDVLVVQDTTAHIVFEKFTDDTYETFIGKYYYWKNDGNEDYYENDGKKDYYSKEGDCATNRFTLETDAAAVQTYINTIEEKLGGKFNRETLEIVKQFEFKDGDILLVADKGLSKHYAITQEMAATIELNPKWTPKPFDCVITRVDDDAVWTANIFSHIDRHGKYVTIGCLSGYHHCIPYNEETTKLIGTTNNWEG